MASIAWSGAGAQTVEPVASVPDASSSMLPARGAGAWRERVQLVWNGETRALERRNYRIWDPLSDLGLDLFWEPARPDLERPGALAGRGLLTWRRAGALRYGTDEIVAQFRGDMQDGRMHGRGTFVHRSGLRYDGEWRDGLMSGQGQFQLPDGDVYSGGFREGRPHGHGLTISASGAVHEGGYAAGRREGPGLVSEANRFTYAGVWRAGTEDRGRRGPAPATWLPVVPVQARAAEPDELAVTVSVGGDPSFCCNAGAPYMRYASTSRPDRLDIYPDAPNVLAAWRGERNIVLQDARDVDWERALAETYSFLNLFHLRTQPVTLLFGLENRGRSPVRIVGAFLEVEESVAETRPALQALELHPLRGQNVDFSIENYGWGAAKDAVLRFHIRAPDAGADSGPMEVAMGDVEAIEQFSFRDAIAGMGVTMAALPAMEEACGSAGDAADACLDSIVAKGDLGRLAPYVREQDGSFGFDVEGELDYSWEDGRGAEQQGTAPFEAFVPLGTFRSGAECEGADTVDVAGLKPFAFEERAEPYRIPLPVAGEAAAGSVSRWRITAEAPRSSTSRFRVVLRLADGRQVGSRPVSLLFLRPQSFPESVRPFQPRC